MFNINSPVWFSEHLNIWRPFFLSSVCEERRREGKTFSTSEMKNQYFFSSTLFSFWCCSCCYIFHYVRRTNTDKHNLCCRMFSLNVSSYEKWKKLLYCIMLYLKFMTRKAKKSKIRERRKFIYTKSSSTDNWKLKTSRSSFFLKLVSKITQL